MNNQEVSEKTGEVPSQTGIRRAGTLATFGVLTVLPALGLEDLQNSIEQLNHVRIGVQYAWTLWKARQTARRWLDERREHQRTRRKSNPKDGEGSDDQSESVS